MALRMEFREEEMLEMTEMVADDLMDGAEEERDGGDGGGSVLGKSSRVGLLTMKGREWSQRQGEPLKWYERFSVYYLPLELGNRSLARAYKVYSGKPQPAAPPDWYDARDRWDWEARANAYDIARTEQRQEMLDTVGLAIEDEIKDALLIALRASVNRIEGLVLDSNSEEMDVKTAMASIPRLARELQDVYGVGKKAGVAKSVEDFLLALPKGLGQRVMVYIDQRQQAQLPANTRGEVVDGKATELKPARLVAKSKRDSKLI